MCWGPPRLGQELFVNLRPSQATTYLNDELYRGIFQVLDHHT